MLVRVNRLDREQSVYKCDRCKKELNWKNKIGIYEGLPNKQPKKKYDYCFRCYRAMEIGTERGLKK